MFVSQRRQYELLVNMHVTYEVLARSENSFTIQTCGGEGMAACPRQWTLPFICHESFEWSFATLYTSGMLSFYIKSRFSFGQNFVVLRSGVESTPLEIFLDSLSAHVVSLLSADLIHLAEQAEFLRRTHNTQIDYICFGGTREAIIGLTEVASMRESITIIGSSQDEIEFFSYPVQLKGLHIQTSDDHLFLDARVESGSILDRSMRLLTSNPALAESVTRLIRLNSNATN